MVVSGSTLNTPRNVILGLDPRMTERMGRVSEDKVTAR